MPEIFIRTRLYYLLSYLVTQLRSLINLYANAQLLTIFISILNLLKLYLPARFSEGSIKGWQLIFSFPTVLFLYIILLWYQMAKKKDTLTKEQGRVITQVSVVTCLLWVLFSCPRRLWNKHFVAFSYTVYCSLQNLSMFNT